jgi:hypothetical protein
MLHQPTRLYRPEVLGVMSRAFDEVCQSLPRLVNGNDDLREQLALLILRHVDEGEHDPIRLSEIEKRKLGCLGNMRK